MGTAPLLVIKPKKGWHFVDFRELLAYRDLFYFLVIRDIKVRYKQTVLGFLWAIIQPLFLMVIFSLFFGNLAKIPSDGIPYPVFSYTALVAWTYFATAVTSSTNSVVSSGGLIAKVYFPRMIAPLAPVLAGLVDFTIAFVILIGMMFYYGIVPNIMILFLPALVMLMALTAAGVGMILAPLNAKYRDIGYTIPFLVQFWMFASPVVYPASMVPEQYRLIYAINPMVGVIEGFRSALLGTVAFPGQMLLISAIISVALCLIGASYFRQTERYFADVI